jgi:hypothetical protein
MEQWNNVKPPPPKRNTHTPHNTHKHNCDCTQSNINVDTNATREERDRNNIDTTSGITVDKELRNIRETDIPQPSETSTVTEVTNVSREERDQNNTDTTDGITVFRDFRDILPFHDRFLQRLGDRHHWVLYRVSFSQSPDQQFDTVCDRTWTKEYGLHEIERLDKTVFMSHCNLS